MSATRRSCIELRNYLLAEGARSEFLRYFEEEFLFSQRAAGMHPLGQFAMEGAADRFVWIRGFENMAARRGALEAFYGGPFWLARRDHANAMMREHHDVHLLRPLSPLAALTGGLVLEDRAREPAGVLSSEAGLVAVDLYRAAPSDRNRLIEVFERDVAPILAKQGHRVIGHFVAELAPNDYPRLPVIQDAGLLVVISTYRDSAQQAVLRRGPDGRTAASALQPLLIAEAQTLWLRPTARSLIRHVEAPAQTQTSSRSHSGPRG